MPAKLEQPIDVSSVIDEFLTATSANIYTYLGAHKSKNGYNFRLYAPNATKVSLVGDFNNWDTSKHELKKIDYRGFFEILDVKIEEYSLYKYAITTTDNTEILKADPFAFFSQERPDTASKTFDIERYPWHDKTYIGKRTKNIDKPLSIYELHLSTFLQKPNGEVYSYEEYAPLIAEYVLANHFTHVEFMPLTEYPFDGSWGYQATGFYSATARYGNPKQLMYLIDYLHQRGIGVILDMVLVHFVKDTHGLFNFDGTHLFEYTDPNWQNSPWGSANFDLGKPLVRNFLLSSANYWLTYFHLDGIRIDAVSHLIFWNGNKGGGLNDGAIEFIKIFNNTLESLHPSVMKIAEDSSDYAKVTANVTEGGLGFDYKWDLGWMNDTLKYFSTDSLFRSKVHNLITFSMHYFYSERFLLPLSHDEVVHLKGSIISKMWGNYEQKFSNVKTLYTYMLMHPGKKLLFMGDEIGEFDEWQEFKPVNFDLLKFPKHDTLRTLIKDLNSIYQYYPCLYANDYKSDNFQWIKVDNAMQSVYIYQRMYKNQTIVVILNMQNRYYPIYEFGVQPGSYEVLIDTDWDIYGGIKSVLKEVIHSQYGYYDNQEHHLHVELSPLSAIVLLKKD
jgi:1,4-alpha-glucan branching enzyme